ncbi:MAG: CRISPR-associated endonuclease Cas2 [Candidatus Chloroheliales bacterium]|nr:MAG: CRISPR-associated endonuclease Cas2 [Chloroflexota bacterium]
MQCLVIYDIPNDAVRTKLGEICLDYGLLRIQYSSFLGELSYSRQNELLAKLTRRLGKREGNIQMYPLCDKDIKLRKVVLVVAEVVIEADGKKAKVKVKGTKKDG